MSINVSCLFDREKIDRTKDYEGHLMVSLNAEDKDFERTPVQVVLVLDVSGSMSWRGGSVHQSKIDSLKDTARKLVENLTSQDRISIVTFRDAVEVVIENQKAENKEVIYSAISNIHANGSTNFSGGILKGLSQVDEKFEGVNRLMVLTDGCPTSGIQDPEALIELISARDTNATMSFFGFGTDCDTELLATMANTGGGNYYFIEDTNDVKSIFARELGGIISCRAQNIEITVKPNKGNEILEVLNDYTVDEKEGNAVIHAEDLYLGENKYILLKMKIPKVKTKPKVRPVSIAHVEIRFDSLETKDTETIELNPKVKFVKPEEEDHVATLEVTEQVALMEAAKAQQKAVTLAGRGLFDDAQEVLTCGGVLLKAAADRGSKIAFFAGGVYSSASSSLNSSSYNKSVGSKLSNAASGMRKCRATANTKMSEMYMTSTQKEMTDNFNRPTQTVDPATSQAPPTAKATGEKSDEDSGSKFSKKRSRG